MPPLGLEPRTYGLCSIAPASEFPGGCSDVTLASTPMLVAQSGRPASTDETTSLMVGVACSSPARRLMPAARAGPQGRRPQVAKRPA